MYGENVYANAAAAWAGPTRGQNDRTSTITPPAAIERYRACVRRSMTHGAAPSHPTALWNMPTTGEKKDVGLPILRASSHR